MEPGAPAARQSGMTPGTPLPRRSSTAIAALLFLLAACGGRTDSAAPGPADTGPGDPDTVALRVDHTGGYVPATYIASRLPLVSVYGDGRVISQGPVITIYPPPALPNVQQQKISPENVGVLVQKARDAGVGTAADLGRPSVTDMPDTRFTITTGGSSTTLSVYALVMDDDTAYQVLTDEQRAARKKLTDFLAELQDLSATLGAGAVGKQEPYPASTLAVIATPYTNQDDVPAEVAWTGPTLPGQTLNADLGVSCATATGDEATAALAAAAKANAATPWTSGGKRWALQFRPLLPDESDCTNLAAQR